MKLDAICRGLLSLLLVVGTWTLIDSLAQNRGGALAAQEKKESDAKKGRTIGVLTVKKDNFIEVKADGEVKGRKYVPRWIGGLPADGGGFDKSMVKAFRALKVGSRIQVDWVFEERLRAVKVKVLQEPKKE